MKKLLLYLTLIGMLYIPKSFAQLNAGDIAFIGVRTDANDGFTWISLTDIPASTEIYFTTKGWNATGGIWYNTPEEHIKYTAPVSGLSCGTIVNITETAANTFSITAGTGTITGTLGSGAWSQAAGDQVLAYRGGSGVEPASPVFIAAVHGDYNSADYNATTTWNAGNSLVSGSYSQLPAGLTNGVNCISLYPAPGPELDNSKYTGTLTGTSAALLASINTAANWTGTDNSVFSIDVAAFPSPSVTCAAPATAPTVSTTAATAITSSGATLAGNASSDGGSAITERGIVYSVTATNADPIIGGGSVTKDTNGSGTGVFSEAIGGLSEATQYSYKAYAINAVGTSYGAAQTFTTTGIPPTVNTFSPLDNATGVIVSSNLVLTFSENIVKGTGNIVIKKTSDDSTIETIDVTTAAVSISGAEATINPSADLGLNTEYYVQIAAGVFKDVATNNYAGIADTTTWSFTTEANQTNTWSGATDTNWVTATNWSLGRAPISTDNVIIADVANDPILKNHRIVNNITINGSGVFTLKFGGDLTVNNNVINNGTISIESPSSLIVKGASSGNITYKRNLGSTNWYLVSNPFNGQSINTFTVTDVAINAIATNGVNYAVAPYDNNGANWNYYTTGAGTNNIASAGNFVAGKGYSMKRTTTGNLIFTGTMPTTDVNIAITDGTANEFNLIGNPYPSFLPVNTNAGALTSAGAANNILTINTAQLQEETLWFWDQSTSSYTQINQASATRFIYPAEGFFVNAKIGGGSFTFTEATQSYLSMFSRTTNNRFEINLAMTDGTTTKNTEIYYINGTTTAFDNGYDSSIFSGTSNNFAVYTQTVTDSQGRKLGIQSLPDNNYENMIIPVGINATSGTEITFSVDAQNIPAGIDIYLENRTDNTFTKLNDNGSYTITLSADTNGVGQFYLRTSSSALGLEDVTLTGVSMYTTDNTTLKIIGLQNGKSTVKMFTVLGKKVLQTSFESTGNNDISLPKLAAGVYIVNVQNTHGTLTKKIILQ